MKIILAVVFFLVSGDTCGASREKESDVRNADHQQLLSQLMADLRTEYNGRLNSMHSQFSKRYDELNLKYEKRYIDLEKRYDELLNVVNGKTRNTRQLDLRKHVAFYAQLTHDISGMGDFQSIVYDLVTTNNGNGYNKADGIFTAPTSGTYVFSWTSANQVHTAMQTELVVDGQMVGRTWSDAYDHQDVAIGSNTAVLNLIQGATVWIRSNTIHSAFIMGGQLTTFSGWLIY